MKTTLKYNLLIISLLVHIFVKAQVFDIVVAKDGSGNYTTIADALNAVTDNNAKRTIILVKRGVYAEKVVMAATKINVSLIGEHVDSVVITCIDYVGKTLTDGTKITGYQLATTFRALANDFYAENITFRNASGNVGQALAISTEADRQIFKNCKFLGFQDTYRAAKKRQFNLNCLVEGGTDFIYAGGQALFEKCTIRCLQNGSMVSAPDEAYNSRPINGTTYYLGLLFSGCNVIAGSGVSSSSYNLGRLWGAQNDASVFVNCTLGTHINSVGWSLMTTGAENSAFVAEYKSRKPDGTLFDVSGRISWSKQLTDEQYQRCYNPDSFFLAKGIVQGANSITPWDPHLSTYSPAKPASVTITDNSLSWTPIKSAKGYVIYRNSVLIGATSTLSFIDNVDGKLAQNTYVVKTVNSWGSLSDSLEEANSVSISVAKDNIIAGSGTLQFSASVLPSKASQDIVWSVNDATIATISSSGLLTPKSGGFVIVKASLKADTSVKSQITITVKEISIAASKTVIRKKESLQLSAQIKPLSLSQNALWSISNSAIATISATGLLTANQAGSITVTATSANDNTISKSITISIKDIADSIKIVAATNTVILRKTALSLVSVIYPNTFNQSVYWSVNNSSLASISSSGTLTPIKTGSIVVTVKAQADTLSCASQTIEIIEVLDSIQISAAKRSLVLGKENLSLTATVYPVSFSQTVLWSVNNAASASISASGTLTPLHAGAILVIAKAKADTSITKQISIVIAQVVDSVDISAPTDKIVLGKGSLQLSASVYPLVYNQGVYWRVDDPTLGTISSSGVLSPLKTGLIWVTAKSKIDTLKYAQQSVWIVEVVDSVKITSSKDTIVLGKETLKLTAAVFPSSFSQTVSWSVSSSQNASISAAGVLTPKAAGVVVVTARSLADTSVKRTKSIIIKTATNTSDDLLAASELYPNPAKDYIYISSGAHSHISIFGLLGNLKLDVYPYNGESIDIRAFSPGIYWVRTSYGGTSKTFKLIKQP